MRQGTVVGHYEIVSALGRGGMAEVWRARDTRLRREVAIKTLPAELSRNADRLARLEREATSLAALNHPNIASIHGIEEHAGERFLVLELVEGATLHHRLLRGDLSIEQSLDIGLQIADALEAAHDKGVIHRDLKPANVKITPEGRVKILDFGLAKSLVPAGADSETLAALPTEIGTILGTPPYMSPEQARGEEVGRQTDIWSLGVLLYEMLTGRLPFRGDSATETLARVLETQPDYSLLPAVVSPRVRHLLEHSLEKDLRRRFQHCGDVRIEIEDALAAPREVAQPSPVRHRLRWAVAALVIAAAAALGWFASRAIGGRAGDGTPAPTARLSIPLPGAPAVWPVGTRHLAVSADGSQVAFAGQRRLWVRRMRDQQATVIGTPVANPFFSPDGEWIGFFGNDALFKVPSRGGTPQLVIASPERNAGGAWGTDGAIVYATTAGIFRVDQEGGDAELLVSPNPERDERLLAWPELLPGGRSLLYTLLREDLDEPPQIVWLDLRTRASHVVLTGGSGPRYAPTGHLVYASGETLQVVSFDAVGGATQGTPTDLPDITIAAAANNGAAEFALSANGTLLFLAPLAAPALQTRLVWVDREGVEELLPLEPGSYTYPRISPDGTLVAVDVNNGVNRDIWIWDVRRQSLTRLTSGPTEDMLPVWSADGARVFFASNRAGTFDVYSQAADGASDARVEVAAPGFQAPSAITPDGKRLIVYENFHDFSLLDLGGTELKPLLHSAAEHRLSEISPDGGWLAYESDESGDRFDIFARPFPEVNARRVKISIDGGRYPRWGALGSDELYYVDLDGSMIAVTVELGPELRVGAAGKLFEGQQPQTGPSGRPYDVSPVDGRFLVSRPGPAQSVPSTTIWVVLNWFEELRAR